MARFRFALEGLLAARLAAERQQQRAVAEIERERRALEDRLRGQQLAILAGRQELRGSLIGRVDTHALRLHAAASVQQMRAAQRMALELAGVHKRLELARTSLVEASRARRAIELLREQRLHAWKASLDKTEAAMLDELAVIAASRQRQQGRGCDH